MMPSELTFFGNGTGMGLHVLLIVFYLIGSPARSVPVKRQRTVKVSIEHDPLQRDSNVLSLLKSETHQVPF